MAQQNNRNITEGLLYLWTNFDDPRLNGLRVIARTSKALTHTDKDTHADSGNDNTRRPKLASGKNQSKVPLLAQLKWTVGYHSNPFQFVYPREGRAVRGRCEGCANTDTRFVSWINKKMIQLMKHWSYVPVVISRWGSFSVEKNRMCYKTYHLFDYLATNHYSSKYSKYHSIYLINFVFVILLYSATPTQI